MSTARDKQICAICTRPAVKKRMNCVNCKQYVHNSCALKKKCCENQKLLSEAVYDSEEEPEPEQTKDVEEVITKNEATLLKMENRELREQNKILRKRVLYLQDEVDAYQDGKFTNDEKNASFQAHVVAACQSTFISAFGNFSKEWREKLEQLALEMQNIKVSLTEMNAVKTDQYSSYQLNEKVNKEDPSILVVPKKQPAIHRINSNLEKMRDRQRQIMNDVINLAEKDVVQKPSYSTASTKNNKKIQSKGVSAPIINNKVSDPSYKPDQIEEEESFQKIHHKKKKPRKYQYEVGEETSDENSFIGTSRKERKIWLFTSGAKEHVTTDIVSDYVSKKINEDKTDVHVKEIIPYHKKQDNKCFLIGVQPKHLEAVYSKKFWPQGIRYSRFNFKKGEHFLEKK
ncbi:hypothetical protein Zmor_009572 [Zophobas morio]|uniref:Phorbol-ester/DAG-type domain-containing protein n=1 Tax=Zophobas morio TaxID=2755281 RepID=A0AA38IPF3_9CUCU|nr:hypothetical protein Zmor_009572 [Zophobas morio]